MEQPPPGHRAPRGRGATDNPDNRYSATCREAVDDGWGSLDGPLPELRTTVTEDASRSVLTFNQSPDVPFDRSINPYRGCEHGCVYCFARPSHAWLGLSPGLDFESRLIYKPRAAERLREELARPGYACAPVALGVNTDAYQPVERRLGVTRSILEVLVETRHPVCVITKSALIERDIDLLQELAGDRCIQVMVSLTTLDKSLARQMEPRAATPRRRLSVIEQLAGAGIPVGVLVAPVIPVLTDAELENLLREASERGAANAGYVLLRLPLEVEGLFRDWLGRHYPSSAGHIMSRIRDCHGGRAYESRFGTRMTGRGQYADLLAQRFALARRRTGLAEHGPGLNCEAFRPPGRGGQMPLFD